MFCICLFVSEAKTNADCQQPQNKKAHKKSFSLQRGFQAGIPNCSWELNCGAGKKRSRGEEGRKERRREMESLFSMEEKDVTVFFTELSQTWCPRGRRPLRLRAKEFWTRSQSFVREDGEPSGRLGSSSLLSGCELWRCCTSEKYPPPAGGAPPGCGFADVIQCNVCDNQIRVEPRPSDESPRLKSPSVV